MYNGFSTYTKEGDVLARIEDTHSSLDVDMVDTENWMRIKHIFFLFWAKANEYEGAEQSLKSLRSFVDDDPPVTNGEEIQTETRSSIECQL